MALQVIGTGFGRTGTLSLKLALEQLGFGPCHHMAEVRDNRTQLPYWQQAAHGKKMDWEQVFAGYKSCVDWPATRYWRELCVRYPSAKVIHSIRDEREWYASMNRTIYPRLVSSIQLEDGYEKDRLAMCDEIIMQQTFHNRFQEPGYAIGVFRAHNDEVIRVVAPERLLVFDVGQGWEPLCEFLEVPVPDSPFPRVNSTAEYRDNMEK